MEIMNMENQSISQLYTELSLNPDLPTLAERCKLLTEILLDCKSLPQTQPVCRCLGRTWKKSKPHSQNQCDFQVVEFEAKKNGRAKRVVAGRYQTKCDYCRA
jgi:hypothetical protein